MLDEQKFNFHPFLFNAMTYPDVRSFAIKLREKLSEVYLDKIPPPVPYEKYDDEDLAVIIERLLLKISKMHTNNPNIEE